MNDDPIKEALTLAEAELRSAVDRYSPFHSAHEGYAIMLEEVHELWEEVKKSPRKRDYEAMHAEAIQVCAMALRFIVDVTLPALAQEKA